MNIKLSRKSGDIQVYVNEYYSLKYFLIFLLNLYHFSSYVDPSKLAASDVLNVYTFDLMDNFTSL
jgi:hypothetical protein